MGNLCYHVGFFTSLFLVENTAADLPGRPPSMRRAASDKAVEAPGGQRARHR